MKNNATPISFSMVCTALNQMRDIGITTPSTPDIITAYKGEYTVDCRTPVKRSWNAAFGRFLKKHRDQLGIVEHFAKQSFKTSDGRRTTCSTWGI